MRISDWSSDVCSSDLLEFYFNRAIMAHQHGASHVGGKSVGDQCAGGGVSRPRTGTGGARSARSGPPPDGTGRRSEERRVGKECVSPGYISVVAVYNKKNNYYYYMFLLLE